MALIVIFSIAIFAFAYVNIKPNTAKVVDNNSIFNDSLDFLNNKNSYLNDLITVGYVENNTNYKLDSISLFQLNDQKKEFSVSLGNFIQKDQIIIRYTEIGCNSCADSTFKYLARHPELTTKYDVTVLVDFSNYDAYLKWRKITEVSYPVMWVSKGNFPFQIERFNSSYIFTISRKLDVDNFFIPNSRFPQFIDNYFYSLEETLEKN